MEFQNGTHKTMKIKISRSYSRKIQVKQYEPADFFCGAEMEKEYEGNDFLIRMKEWSEALDKFCQAEVAKSIQVFRPTSKPIGKVDKKKSKDVGIEDANLDIPADEEHPYHED